MKKSGKRDPSSDNRVNQLGGSYRNGKPLSNEMRRKVIELSLSGIRPCEISRQLKITHGCISKLLSKFFKTGSLVPGHGTAGRPRVITPWIEMHIDRYRKEQPGIFSWEIRERLLRENVCFETSLPSLSSINRLVKSKIKQQCSEQERSKINNEFEKDSHHNINHERKINSNYTIDNILSSKDNIRTTKTTVTYHPVQVIRSTGYERQKTEEEYSNDSCQEWKAVLPQEESEDEKRFFHTSKSPLRRQRMRFSRHQMKCLEKEFELNPYPSNKERENISNALEVEEAKVRVWFSNRRAKVRSRVSPTIHSYHSLPYPSTTNNKGCHSCTCNHINKPAMFPLQISAGPSRLFFPSGYRPLH
ncbi:paired box protein Pax-6-like [Actinia tenebrosa]|uniref:Paired box protein Pax-6-like n=1 Tax=Actinia tenebrosa TaxID=6105 RepID=A0A6P8IS44_ACTTE|nr:paired box protein Pax-6-like [Actinia tenebrosa]XP_031569063.1 paired box protein Pax-6-like [Actinia tenebrosa]